MKRTLLIPVLLMGLAPAWLAQPALAAWPVLDERVVERFVETFPGMYREYVERGLRIDPQQGRVSGAWKTKRNEEVQRILAENGWDFMFWPRLQAIVRGYSLAKYEQAVSEHGGNIEKFVEDLKAAEWMTPQKRAELEAFYRKLKIDFESRAKTLRRQVHRNDLRLVERALPELDSVMQELIKIEWEHALAKFAQGRQNPGST